MTNVVILMSDQHNPRYSSVYAHPFVHTPNLESLASQGTLFRNAYCPSPLCLPSRSAFVSGKRVHEIQTYSNCQVNLDPSHESYGAALNRQGVYSVHIGKTDFHTVGEKLGFTEMYPRNTAFPGDLGQRHNPMHIREGAERRANFFGPKRHLKREEDLEDIETSIQWLKTKPKTLTKPWVLTVNIYNPHFPHYPPQNWWDFYKDKEDLPTYLVDAETAQHPFAQAQRQHFQVQDFKEEQVRGLRRGYYGCVSFVDEQLGRLMQTLEEEGLKETTNLIYTSDHGEMLGKFGMWWKCSLYEDSVRIPCIAAGPDFQVNHRVETPVDLHDVQASLFEVTEVERPAEWVGIPLNKIEQNDTERVVFAEYHGHATYGSSYMVRQNNWKYLHYIDAPDQLFDLQEDPDEINNLLENQPEVLQRLHAHLEKICNPRKEYQSAETFIETQLNNYQKMMSN